MNVLDNIPEGIEDVTNNVIAIQYNPLPNPTSEEYIFNRFAKLMKNCGGKKNA